MSSGSASGGDSRGGPAVGRALVAVGAGWWVAAAVATAGVLVATIGVLVAADGVLVAVAAVGSVEGPGRSGTSALAGS